MKLQHRGDPEQRRRTSTRCAAALLDIPWPQRQQLLGRAATGSTSSRPAPIPCPRSATAHEYAQLIREAAGYGPTRRTGSRTLRAWRPRTKVGAALSVVHRARARDRDPVNARREAVRGAINR